MSILETIYRRLSVTMQHAACSLHGWQIERSRYGRGFAEALAAAEERSSWSHERICEFRDRRLREFLIHAAATTSYYGALFRRLGVDPASIRRLDDLRQLPILTKDEVRARYPEMLSEAVRPSARAIAHTSGTTGAGLRFATTAAALQEQWAVWWRYRRWHGLQRGTWCGYFAGRSVVPLAQGRPPFWRYNLPGRQILMSGYHISPANLPAYVALLRRRRPPWLHGYPSLLALLATHLLDSGGGLGYPVRWVTVGAENLLPQQAERIESALGVAPVQHYGMAEAVANISQCPAGALHVDEDFAAAELVPAENGTYRIVGTNLSNPATPLVRYDTQDLVVPAEGPCACGRPGRIVRRLDGRREDYVLLPGGARVGRMDHVFKDQVNVREAQIVQCRPEAIALRVVRRDGYSPADERRLLAELRQRVGPDLEINIEYVESIPRTATGKLRLVVSEIPEGALGGPPTVGGGTP